MAVRMSCCLADPGVSWEEAMQSGLWAISSDLLPARLGCRPVGLGQAGLRAGREQPEAPALSRGPNPHALSAVSWTHLP